MNRLIRLILDPLQHDSHPSEDDPPAARGRFGAIRDRATTEISLTRSLRRFAVEGLCLLMLLYGAPLQALESNLPKVEVDAPDIPVEIMELDLDSGWCV